MFSRGRGYLSPYSPDVEIFDCRLGRKRLRPNICFPASTLHARDIRSGIERSENHGSQREQAKGELISLYWSIEPLRYCGIKVNGSKEKPRRFLQVLISVWPIRYNHCIKLKKLTFFVAFTKNSISNLQNVDFLVKVSVSCYAVY